MTSVTGALGGRVAWVTGSSRGLGRVIAAYLASLGARVVVHGTTPTSTRAFDEADSLAAVANEIATASDMVSTTKSAPLRTSDWCIT